MKKVHSHSQYLRNTKVEKSTLLQKEDIPVFQSCLKFSQRININQHGFERAITFLNLVDKQCNKRDALLFSQRRICKFDSTLTRDGPASCRMLKPQKVEKSTVNGWQNLGQDVKYDVGCEFEPNYQVFALETDNDRQLAQHFAKNEAKIKNSFKANMQSFSDFYHDMNVKYCFTLSGQGGKQQLKDRIKQANQEYRLSRDVPIKYIKYKGVRFINILDEIKDNLKQHDNDSRSIVQELKAFKSIVPSKKKFSVKQKFADDLFMHINKGDHDSNRGQQHAFQKLEDETKRMMRMADSKGVYQVADQVSNTQDQQYESVGTNKDMFAAQFNESQYIYKVKEVYTQNEQKRIDQLQKIIEQADNSENGPDSPTSPDRSINESIQNYQSPRNDHKGYQLNLKEISDYQVKVFGCKSEVGSNLQSCADLGSTKHMKEGSPIHSTNHMRDGSPIHSSNRRTSQLEQTSISKIPLKLKLPNKIMTKTQKNRFIEASNLKQKREEIFESKMNQFVKQKIKDINLHSSSNGMPIDTQELDQLLLKHKLLKECEMRRLEIKPKTALQKLKLTLTPRIIDVKRLTQQPMTQSVHSPNKSHRRVFNSYHQTSTTSLNKDVLSNCLFS